MQQIIIINPGKSRISLGCFGGPEKALLINKQQKKFLLLSFDWN